MNSIIDLEDNNNRKKLTMELAPELTLQKITWEKKMPKNKQKPSRHLKCSKNTDTNFETTNFNHQQYNNDRTEVIANPGLGLNPDRNLNATLKINNQM